MLDGIPRPRRHARTGGAAISRSAGRGLATAIKLTPGGVGVVELVLIAGLSAIGGDEADIVAAVLVFRFLTYAVPIPIGGLTYLWWRTNRSWRAEPPAGTEPA